VAVERHGARSRFLQGALASTPVYLHGLARCAVFIVADVRTRCYWDLLKIINKLVILIAILALMRGDSLARLRGSFRFALTRALEGLFSVCSYAHPSIALAPRRPRRTGSRCWPQGTTWRSLFRRTPSRRRSWRRMRAPPVGRATGAAIHPLAPAPAPRGATGTGSGGPL
jgi:hypothetical protein